MRNEFGDKRKSKSLDEANYFTFINKNLDELLSLFQSQQERSNQHDYYINDDVLQALSFLFDGSINNLQTILPFHLLIKQPTILSQFVSFYIIFISDIGFSTL